LKIDGLVLHGESTFCKFIHNDPHVRLFVIESNDQDIGLFYFMGLDAVYSLPYPFRGASGKTPGNGQLHDSFRRENHIRARQQENEHQQKTRNFLHHQLHICYSPVYYDKSPKLATAICN